MRATTGPAAAARPQLCEPVGFRSAASPLFNQDTCMQQSHGESGWPQTTQVVCSVVEWHLAFTQTHVSGLKMKVRLDTEEAWKFAHNAANRSTSQQLCFGY